MEHSLILMKLGMGRYPAVDVAVRIDILIKACTYFFNKGEAFAFVTQKGESEPDPSNAIYISDIKHADHAFMLLLVRGDPKRAVPSFVNPTQRKVTKITSKEPGDVPGASCHIVISTQEIVAGADQGRFRMAMERTTGIGRALARDFIGDLLTRYAKAHQEEFRAEKKRRSRRQPVEIVNYRPTVRFHPQQNASLKKDLESGRIGGFKLVNGTTTFEGEASAPKIKRLDVQLRASLAPTEDLKGVTTLISGIRNAINAVTFGDFKLELVDESGNSTGLTQAIAVDSMDDSDLRYCKRIPITGINGEIQECYENFHEEILVFANAAISTESYWI